MASNDNSSDGDFQVIIKRYDDDHGEHQHGGAWKIAYADFVTAMMAFFLLLWLLSSADEEALKGVADHFAPSESVVGGLGGDGVLAGQTPDDHGISPGMLGDPFETSVPPDAAIDDPWARIAEALEEDRQRSFYDANGAAEEAKRRERVEDIARLEEARAQLDREIRNTPGLAELADSVRFERVEDGLMIQIMDQEGQPMFDSGQANFRPQIETLVARVADVIEDRPNPITITGHTDAVPFGGDNGYTNWELSADRANATRRLLLQSGIAPERFHRISGVAATSPLRPELPEDASNRRITIHLKFIDPIDVP